ncbi:PREDICTED: uncharacterized transmembrane protein DDB_G0289901 [Tarenaya hassleriana]|uniref:uncharacterized transmembrane protein DDB_G0289901 n=1 Tax=Tarenaya hassleriana TaxID=28532 RepID=UPI00053C818B|nr:PREDICTED: uncharacterized transmembrane protein DDB_G0289901 [Tarenaya hassleriana]XP_010524553.1 PREDICTED: uncharacterized transmembrane protein DDB_G0289901 [Tarenaya hassleriana]
MNSNYGKGSSGSMNSFNFDLGLGSNQGRSLKDQKSQPSPYSSSNSHPRPAWQPGKPSWTHQPAPKQATARSEIGSGPSSMVGDIFGKTWGSSSGSGSGIGIVNKDPTLFGDLVTSAIGQGKSTGNVPLKNATPTSAPGSNKSSYSMGNLADSLPKSGNSGRTGANWGYGNSSGGSNFGVNANNSSKTPNLGGPTMKNMAGSNVSGLGLRSNGDPFGSLVDFGSKPSGNIGSGAKTTKANVQSDGFGDFQSSSQSGAFNANGNGFAASSEKTDSFGEFQNAPKSSSTSAFPSGGFSSNANSFNDPNIDFGMPKSGFPSQAQSSSDDPLGMFSSSTAAAPATSQPDDWGFEGFDNAADSGGGSTTELDGLPPPPAGVSATSAKSKGIDNQKQGQYADAIKWLSWAVILMEKAGDQAGTAEVLSIRASCYKEVGEYKKAVADCTKVLEQDEKNASVLVQRALLYESMEKYKLGAEDLRMVLKIDPGNRVARSTIHRLTKMAE